MNYHYQADNQADTLVRTIRLILRYYQADSSGDSDNHNQADTPYYQLRADKDNQADSFVVTLLAVAAAVRQLCDSCATLVFVLQARLAKNQKKIANICHAITDPPVTKIRL